MKHLLPQFLSILVIYCFCLLQHPSAGYARLLDDSPDGLDIVHLECLFHYSRTQELTHPIKIGFPPMHLMHLAAKLSNGQMKGFLQCNSRVAALDFTKKVCKAAKKDL
ncbi:LOW QUALITY PROTEIN: neuromedin-S [Rhynchonycteris naso]